MIQSSGVAEPEILSPISDSWSDAQIHDLCASWTSATRPNLCTTTSIQSLAEQVQLPDFVDPIEDFTEEDSITKIMSVTGRSPKHPRTGSDDNGLDVGALLDKAADRFSACMDAKIDSMMDQLDKRIEDKVDSKLGPVMDKLSAFDSKLVPVMDRLSALEKTSTSSTKEWTFIFFVRWIIWQRLRTNDICAFLTGNQGVVCFP